MDDPTTAKYYAATDDAGAAKFVRCCRHHWCCPNNALLLLLPPKWYAVANAAVAQITMCCHCPIRTYRFANIWKIWERRRRILMRCSLKQAIAKRKQWVKYNELVPSGREASNKNCLALTAGWLAGTSSCPTLPKFERSGKGGEGWWDVTWTSKNTEETAIGNLQMPMNESTMKDDTVDNIFCEESERDFHLSDNGTQRF